MNATPIRRLEVSCDKSGRYESVKDQQVKDQKAVHGHNFRMLSTRLCQIMAKNHRAENCERAIMPDGRELRVCRISIYGRGPKKR